MDSDSSYDDEANKADLKAFSESLFSAEEGNEFKELHPTLRLQQPEHLKASIPIVVHEDTEIYRINIAHSLLVQLQQPLPFCFTPCLGFAMAKALDQTAFRQTRLLKACVRSVVYHLRKDLEKLDDVLYWEEEDAGCCGRALSETEERVTQAQRQLWYSVQRMKLLQGDGTSAAWIRVKQGRIFFWVRIDDPEHLRLLHLWLPSECRK